MRTFALINADGIRKDLTLKKSLFLYNVDGLGFEDDYELQGIGERFSVIRDEIMQGEIEGTVKFWQPGAEQAFFDFVQFCQNGPLRLVYNPGIGDFYRNGIITGIGKSDSADGALKCTVRFSCTTPWYKLIEAYTSSYGTGGKKYPYKYPYRYGGGASQSVTIESNSYQPSPVKLTIYGPANNPSWRWYLNNQLVGTGKVNGVIEDNRKLVIDTTKVPYEIRQYDLVNNLISDMYQQSDFSTKRFIRLGYGRNVISVSQEGTGNLRMGVEAQVEYAAV